MSNGISFFDLPDIVEHMGELLRARDQDGFTAYLLELQAKAKNTETIVAIAEDVLAAQPDDVKAWWAGPCACGVVGPHSHN